MVRTQIQLTDEQYRSLKAWARRLNISLSEAIRRCVAERLAREEGAPTRATMVREAMAVLGKYRDPTGAVDVAERHDDYLADAYEDS